MKTSSRAPHTETATSRVVLLILAIFVLVNAVIAWFTVDGAALGFGGDASSWYEPALGLLKHGGFVDPDNPSKLLTARPPLYPMFAAAALYLSGGAMWSVIVGQVALLFATGWLARAMTEAWLPGYGNVMLALVIFNPNALGTAHLFQSDTLYAFVSTAVLCSLLFFARAPNWTLAAASGALFGLSLLARTTAQFLLYVWPFAMLLLGVVARGWRAWSRFLVMGFVSAIIAVAVIVPWVLHNQRAGEGLSLTTNYLKSYFLWDNIAYLEKYDKNIGQTQAERAAERRQNEFARQYGPNFNKLPDRQKFAYLEERGRELFLSYPAHTFARAFVWAWAQFYGVPGVSNFLNLFGLGEQTAFARYRQQKYDNYLQAGIDALKNASPVFTVLTVAGFLFILVLRILGLIGVVTVFRRRLWPIVLVVGGGLGYFTLIHLFVANSRYRLPIESLLFLLALYGLDGLRRRAVTSEHQ
jgi:hypothetical protein